MEFPTCVHVLILVSACAFFCLLCAVHWAASRSGLQLRLLSCRTMHYAYCGHVVYWYKYLYPTRKRNASSLHALWDLGCGDEMMRCDTCMHARWPQDLYRYWMYSVWQRACTGMNNFWTFNEIRHVLKTAHPIIILLLWARVCITPKNYEIRLVKERHVTQSSLFLSSSTDGSSWWYHVDERRGFLLLKRLVGSMQGQVLMPSDHLALPVRLFDHHSIIPKQTRQPTSRD